MASPTEHAALNASGAHCWAHCTASPALVKANKHRIVDNGSDYSRLGTTQHSWNEKLLREEVTLEEIPSEHRPWAEMWREHLWTLMDGPGEPYIEAQVPLFYALDDKPGTMDFGWVSEQRITIRDYKHGEGQPVSPEFNEQLAIYAQSLITHLHNEGLHSFAPETVVDIGIVQPRYRGEDAIKVWITSVAELAEFCASVITPAVEIIRAGEQITYAPSVDVCRFCKAKEFCTARATAFEALPSSLNPLEVFTDLDAPEVDTLTDEQLASIYRNGKQITKFIADVEAYLTNAVLDGRQIEGTKLVMGREGNRKYVDQEKAEKTFRNWGLKFEDFSDRVMHSPAKMEKHPVVKSKMENTRSANIFQGLLERAPAKRVLALIEDKRPAVDATDPLPAEFTDLDVVDE